MDEILMSTIQKELQKCKEDWMLNGIMNYINF